jgi:hypothetical protein
MFWLVAENPMRPGTDDFCGFADIANIEPRRARSTCLHRVFALCLLMVSLAASLGAAELSESDKYFLAGYEKLRAALTADDLVRANEVAQELTDSGIEVPRSETLERARAAFAKVSDIAIKLASGQPGYYIMHCPMLNRDWVQTSKQVANPYGGKDMVSCGEIKSQ